MRETYVIKHQEINVSPVSDDHPQVVRQRHVQLEEPGVGVEVHDVGKILLFCHLALPPPLSTAQLRRCEVLLQFRFVVADEVLGAVEIVP